MRLFSLVFMFSLVTLRRNNTFFKEYVVTQTHNHFKSYQGSKVIVSFQNYDNLGQKKKWEFLSKIWTQKFRYHCLFRGLLEMIVGLCRDILHKKGVSASKSHRGRLENKWKQSDENFDPIFFDFFELRNFEETSFYIPPKWISSNFKVV